MISVDVTTAMTTPVRTVGPSATMVEAAKALREAGIGALVVEDDGEMVGVVTESDVVELVTSGDNLSSATVADWMTSPVVTIQSDETVVAAGQCMRDNSVRRLPVVDGGELVGIVTTTDLAYYLPRLRTTIRRERGETRPDEGAR